MNWSDFNALVRVHLHTHNRRQGIQTLIDTLVHAAILDLQGSIPEFRVRETTVFESSDLTVSGEAQTGSISPGRKIVRAYARLASDHTETDEFEFYDGRLSDRQDNGVVLQSPRLFSYSPVTGAFRITPALSDDSSELVLIHEGPSFTISESAEVPFDEQVAEVVADYVLTKLSMDVDRDMQAAQAHRQLYSAGKRRLLADLRENQLPPWTS